MNRRYINFFGTIIWNNKHIIILVVILLKLLLKSKALTKYLIHFFNKYIKKPLKIFRGFYK